MGVIIIFFLQEKNIWANNDVLGLFEKPSRMAG
jgi:hypothetical protein